MRSVIVWMLCSISLISISNQSKGQDINETLAFAESLFNQNQYEQAIPVLERVVFFGSPQHLQKASYLLAQSYLQINEFDKALTFLDEAYMFNSDPQIKYEICFLKSSLYLKSNNAGFALIELLNLQTQDDIELEKRKLFYLAAARMKLGQYSLAKQNLNRYCYLSKDSMLQMILDDTFNDTLKINRFNEKWAAYSSFIIPGSGQIISGDISNGINSFILVGSLEAAFIYMSLKYSILDAYLTIFPWWQRYYSGGYQAAKKSASNKKQKLKNDFYEKVLSQVYYHSY